MNKRQKIIFALSVALTLVSVIAYASDRIIFLVLSSAAASYGYFMACGSATGSFFPSNQETPADNAESQNMASNDQSAAR